jgi:hypothetical protein
MKSGEESRARELGEARERGYAAASPGSRLPAKDARPCLTYESCLRSGYFDMGDIVTRWFARAPAQLNAIGVYR